jgi:segregation and condensation protein A
LYELIKSYSNHIMQKNFLSMNIPKLPVCTAEHAIKIIRNNINKLSNWRDFLELVPKHYTKSKKLKKTGIAGFFAGSLELTREGLIDIMQDKTYDKILIKHKK